MSDLKTTKPDEPKALLDAIRRLRVAMAGERWSWVEIEAFLGGSMSLDLDTDQILDLLRGPAAVAPATVGHDCTCEFQPACEPHTWTFGNVALCGFHDHAET